MHTDFDVAIVGGGPNGAVAAALLARHGGILPERIVLIAPELASESAALMPAGAPAPRVAAISRASEMVLKNAGAWSRLPPERLCAYQHMRVWHESVPSDGPETLVFSAAEVAEANLGHIIENRALSAAALAAFREQGGQLLGERVAGLKVTGDAAHVRCGTAELSARLVIGADGAHSRIREFLQVPLHEHDYRQSAIVANLESARSHQHTAWQRFLASGPLALLPLFDGSSSIVWSAEHSLASELMALPADEFARRVDEASAQVLGATRLVSERVRVPLRRASAASMIGPRAALLGDAAHVIHPLAGQGVNLGFLDAAVLCDVLAAGVAEREDPGAARLLTRYEQLRLTHDTLMSWSMSAFNELFTRGGGPGGWLAARLLGLAGASGVTRRSFARRALGLSGELPSLARRVRAVPESAAVAC